ncbi:MAG TPA: ExeM/NucH family extracellular endonuclease, partial [Blastocatellia bacterium]|nr:ExeM/NucH family extracellular endonuclease [Blastocatellia bacterium]
MRRLTKLFSSLFTFPHPRPAQRTRLAVLSAFAMATVALSIYALIAPPGARGLSSDVVISQVYGGGGATSGTPTYINDYIELFNRGNSPVTLTGYALQYGSSAGNFGASASQIYAISTVTIQPGKYLLIQVGGAGTVGAALPVTPDQTTGNISMSAASGKIALANTATGLGCGATATPCTLPDVRIVDSVSYGASNNGEGGTTVNNGSALTNTQGGVRKTNGCTETDNNNSDFSVVTAPVPRNSATAANPCTPLTPTLSINDVTMSEGNAGTTIFTFTVSLNSAAGAGGVSFDIATADGTATTADNDYVAANQAGKTIAAGQTSTTFDVTVNGDTTFEPNETFFVNVTNVSGATLGDGQGQGTINNDDVSPLPLLSINDVSAAEGNAGTTTFTFTVSLSMPAGAGGVSFDIATADGTATVANNDYVAAAQMGKTIAAGQSSTTFDVMVNGDTAGEPDETFTVNITNVSGASLNDGTGLGTIQNDDLNLTLIHDIQGTSETPNFVGQSKIIQGIVVGNFQTSAGLSGFFVEEEQSDWDADPNTSEGIFVFDGATPVTTVNVGDKVTVTGTVLNFGGPPGLTELSPTTSVVVNSSGNTLPPAQTVTLPVGTSPATDLEKYEGMRVQFAQSLFVTGNADLAHFGELNLSANSKLYIPTNSVDPNDNPASGNSISGNSNVPAVTAQQTLNNNSRIILDDGKSGTYPNPIPFLGAGTNATIRLGDSVSSLSGVMSYGFGSYRIEPTGPVAFNALNPRPAAPASVGNSTLRVVSFNVENYFATTGTGRGPDNATELQRKRAKVAAALAGLNADVIGLIELEKGTQAVPDAAVNDIISALNTLGVGTYAAVSTPTAVYTVPVGTDTDIKSGIIYRTSAVTTVGASFTDTTAPVGTYSRAPIAQTFQQTSNGEKFTFVVNHFRSKGCSGGSGLDADQGDGQACFNDRRRNQAQSVVAFVNSTILPIDPDVLVVGDLNAYGQEDPVDVFRAAGYSDVVGQYVSLADQYSFTFSGEIGRLDHAFATGNLANQITGGTIWHINADEPAAFDYNTENKPDDRYAPTPYASADHNPVLVGIALSSAPCPTITVTPSSVPAGTAGAAYGPVQFSQT